MVAKFKQKSRSASQTFTRLLTGLFVGANIMSLLVIYICCATTWMDPSAHPRAAVMGLFFPFLLFANVAFIPFWLIFSKKHVLIPIVGLLLCGSFIIDYFPISFRQKTQPSDSTITVLTWNTNNFGAKTDSGWYDITQYLIMHKPDIICLEENYGNDDKKQNLNDWATENGYEYSFFYRGRDIYSRYPIVSADTISVHTATCNGITDYRLQILNDTVHVIVAHLESNCLTPDEKDEYHGMLDDPHKERVEESGRMLLSKLADAASRRGPQVDSLVRFIHGIEGQSVILCGDFNDTPISYSYQQVSRLLDNAYRHSGNGIGISYNQPYFWVRIDHLFYSSDWESVSAKIDDSIVASDHYPLLVTLKKRQK